MKSKTLFPAFFVALALIATWNAKAILYNGHEYQLTSAALMWAAAEIQAVSKGGHLVTINDQAEAEFLTFNFTGMLFWIGLNDRAAEGTWEWVSGEAVTFTNWNTGQPDGGVNENAVVMNFNWPGNWGDVPEFDQHYGIIETSVPDGGSTGVLVLGGLLALLGFKGTSRQLRA